MWPTAASARLFLVPPVPGRGIAISPLAASRNDKEGEGGDQRPATKPLSGLDVLWAMQRAAAEKTGSGDRKRRKGKPAGRESYKGGRRGGEKEEEEGHVDYRKVRPLCVKREWGVKLGELEKRLLDLSPAPSHLQQ